MIEAIPEMTSLSQPSSPRMMRVRATAPRTNAGKNHGLLRLDLEDQDEASAPLVGVPDAVSFQSGTSLNRSPAPYSSGIRDKD